MINCNNLLTRWACALILISLLATAPATASAQRSNLRSAVPNAPKDAAAKTQPPQPSQKSGDFAVEKFFPEGNAETYSIIFLTFNQDVITSDALEKGDTPKSVISFDPPLEGDFVWQTLRKAKFTPRNLKTATAYAAHINPLLRSAANKKLAEEKTFRFHTPALTLDEVKQANFLSGRRAVLSLEFSDKVDPRGLLKHLQLESDSQPVQWKLYNEVATNKPMIVTDPVSTESLIVKLLPGMPGLSGPLANRNPVVMPVKLSFVMTAVSVKGKWDKGIPELVVDFSDNVSPSAGEKFVTVSPPVENMHFSSPNGDLRIMGDFEAEKRYTVSVAKGVESNSGRVLIKPVKLSVWIPPMTPFMDIDNTSGYLSTKSSMKIPIKSVLVDRVKVTASRLLDNNMVFSTLFNNGYDDNDNMSREVATRTYNVTPAPNRIQNSEIDLREFLGEKATGVYRIEIMAHTPQVELLPTGGSYYERSDARRSMSSTIRVNLSNLGIISKEGPGEVRVFVAALDTAKPLKDITVQLFTTKNQFVGEAITDAQGFAVLNNFAIEPDVKPATILAFNADKSEMTMLDIRNSLENRPEFDSEGRRFLRNGYEAFVTPERGAYRPGETVHVTGFIRGRDSSVVSQSFPAQVVLTRADGKELTPIVITPSNTGLLDFDLEIPAYAPTGQYRVVVRMPGKDDDNSGYPSYDYWNDGNNRDNEDFMPLTTLGQTDFLVEEFVPNRIKVEASADDKRFSPDNPLAINVSAEEMFGQPLAGRRLSGLVTWSAESFKPEQWKDYTFGDSEKKFTEHELTLGKQMLGDNGKTTVSIAPPPGYNPPAALRATVQVAVHDGGRGIIRQVARTVDPVPYYLGLHNQSGTYPRTGAPANFDLVAVKPDGEISPLDETLSGSISRIKWNSSLERSGNSYSFTTTRELEYVTSTSVTLSGGRGTISWTPISTGNYLVRVGNSEVSVSDDYYVSDSNWGHQPWSLEKPETAELVLDKEKYSAGETAKLLIKAPFPGTVLLTLEQDRVVSSTVLTMTENTIEVPIKLTESMLPNVYAVASVIRPVTAEKQWLPHRAVGMINLPVTTGSRVLDISLTAPKEVRPGAELTVTADIRDNLTSAPVAGDVILWAVDEGILSLTDFETPEPGDYFSAARRLMVRTADFFSELMPDIISSAVTLSATGGGDAESGPRFSPVDNERVKSVILWNGPAKSDANGKLQVSWKVPQFMGRLRIMAMASDHKRFGSSDVVTYVRNPVMVKEYLPRFAAPGDKFEAGFTVYNNTDAPMTPALGVMGSDLMKVEPATTQTLDAVPPRSQATVYRTLSTPPERIGQGVVTFAASANNEDFGSSVSIPVRPASPRIRLSDSVVLKSGDNESMKIKGTDFLPDTTTVTLVASGMPTLGLAEALKYNAEYPYGCTEQVISKIFPLLYLTDLAKATEPGRYSEDGLRMIVQDGIDRVLMAQLPSGGLAMWVGQHDTWPWASVYGAHFLVEAEKVGYQVNPEYKKTLLDFIQEEVSGSVQYDSTEDLTRRAYACYVLARSGRKIHQHLATLQGVEKKLSFEARALTAATYLELGMKPEASAILQITASSDGPTTTGRTLSGILSSPTRETSLLLMAWLKMDTNSVQVAELVKRLLALKTNGHWMSTQDNSFAMMALGQYAKGMTSSEPVSGTLKFAGKSYDFSSSAPLTISRKDLAGEDVEITCNSGNAYVWYAAEGVPTTPPNQPVAEGLSIARRYLDQKGKELDTNHLPQGELVIIELSITGERSLDNVVLQDLLPAGLEIENPRLTSTEKVAEAEQSEGVVVNRLDVRDDRMLIFANLRKPKKKIQKYRYTARAVTPGHFTLPPAMLDVMYDPTILARTAPGQITIEPIK